MSKSYKLLIDSPEYPKDTEARLINDSDNCLNYFLYVDGVNRGGATKAQIEDRPNVWQLIEEKKEEEINKYLPFTPEPNETYFYISEFGDVIESYKKNSLDGMRIKNGVFRTEAAAKMEALRRESRAEAWMPENELEDFYVVSLEGAVYKSCLTDPKNYNYLMGNVHRSEEEAQAWKEKYLPAFQCLFR